MDIKLIKWTDDMIKIEAKKNYTRNEFRKCSESAYKIAIKRGILDDVCSHMIKLKN